MNRTTADDSNEHKWRQERARRDRAIQIVHDSK